MTDGNSPAFWVDDTLRVYTSSGMPEAMSGVDLYRLQRDDSPIVEPSDHYPLWIEGVWEDEDGTVYAWYHHEADGGCAYRGLMTPQIGALVSSDGGKTFKDLGIVLSSGDVPDCGAQNGFFAGGHGDFSVILEGTGEYFYFLFTNYGGAAATQGVAMARMAFEDRGDPVGAVYKYHQGEWSESGLGGTATPILPATVSWDRADTSSFWGPAVHWNTYLTIPKCSGPVPVRLIASSAKPAGSSSRECRSGKSSSPTRQITRYGSGTTGHPPLGANRPSI